MPVTQPPTQQQGNWAEPTGPQPLLCSIWDGPALSQGVQGPIVDARGQPSIAGRKGWAPQHPWVPPALKATHTPFSRHTQSQGLVLLPLSVWNT